MTGIIPFYKGQNCTSFKAVAIVRHITNEKKCGHTGTLDPMATGVLPIALGRATRFIELLPDHTKSYQAEFRLGICTDTLDIWGEVTEQSGKTATYEAVKEAAESFKGQIMQVPPMYSALKKDGVRLYELARKGETVEREERPCEIYSLEIFPCENGDFSLEVTCSAGTYIRTLISDIGEKLGTGAVMTSLERTKACALEKSRCVTEEMLKKYAEENRLNELLIPIEELLKEYPAVNVTTAQGKRFLNGGELSKERFYHKNIIGLCRVYADGDFLGIGEMAEDSDVMSVKRIYFEG